MTAITSPGRMKGLRSEEPHIASHIVVGKLSGVNVIVVAVEGIERKRRVYRRFESPTRFHHSASVCCP